MRTPAVIVPVFGLLLSAALLAPSDVEAAKKKRPASSKKRAPKSVAPAEPTPTFEPDPIPSAQASDAESALERKEPEPPKTAPRTRSKLTALHVALGARVFSRNFSYKNDTSGVLPVYELAASAELVLHADWYPGAHFTSKWYSHLGLLLDVDVGLGVKSKNAAGTVFNNQVWGLSVAAQGRVPLPLRTSEFNLHLGYTTQRYGFQDASTERRPLIPNVTYQALRVGLGTYLNVHDRFGISLLFSYLYPFSTGEISRAIFFPHATAHGIDLDLFLHVRLIKGLELQGGFEMRMWMFSMNTQPADTFVVGGANDRYIAGTVRLAYRF